MPVGIINSSWGGTAAELWTPIEEIESDAELLKNSKQVQGSSGKPSAPAVLWNAMVHPLAGYRIAGAFWYQGESNTETYSGYHKLFSKMIESWRKAWAYDFPFYYVQIAPYSYTSKPEEQKGALLREQQTKTLSLPNTGMVVTTDLVPDITNIHPTKKKDVAARLAEMALVEVYSKKATDYKSPVYKSHKVAGNKIVIDFDYLAGKLQVNGKTITDLYIADKSRNFVPAEFRIE
ncbi:MAG: sialate O-acetylesterase, partial [Pedobacter sp.]